MTKYPVADTPATKLARSFAQFYEEISQDWQGRAERLQERRWQRISERESDRKSRSR